MEREIAELLEILGKEQKPISVSRLAKQLNYSLNRTRTLVRAAMDALPSSIGCIQSRAGQGYSLLVNDENSLNKYLLMLRDTQKKELYSDRDVRVFSLLNTLLTEEYTKADALADRLFISRSQLTNDLKIVRSLLRRYDLELISVPYHGLTVKGDELQKRLCMSNYLQKDVYFDWQNIPMIREILPSNLVITLKNVIQDKLRDRNCNVSETALQGLYIHLAIMLLRVQKGKRIDESEFKDQEKITDTDLFELSREILTEISDMFHITFDIGDQMYLTIQLIGKRYFDDKKELVINKDVGELVNLMLETVKKEYSVDLFNDLELRIQLGLHLIPLLARLKYHLTMSNPLLDEIKINFVYSFDMALSCCKILERKLNCELSEDEASYLALYFGIALSKVHKTTKKKILLVGQFNRAGLEKIRSELFLHFPNYLSEVDYCFQYELKEKNLSGYDYLFTTVNLKDLDNAIHIPIIYMKYFLREYEWNTIENILTSSAFSFDQYFSEDLFFIDVHGETKEEVIRKMTGWIHEKREIPENFYDEIITREEASPTDFGYKIALPHPKRPAGNTTFVCVAILDQPIFWSTKKVQIIMLVSIEKGSLKKIQDFYQKVIAFILDKEKINELLNTPSFDKLRELFMRQQEDSE